LIYYDEVGFSASPPVQRAWSPLGCPHAVTPAPHQRVAVMGALDFAGQRLYHAQAASTVNRETFIDFMEDLIPRIAKPVPTLIILDNARIHHGLSDSLTLRYPPTFLFSPADISQSTCFLHKVFEPTRTTKTDASVMYPSRIRRLM